MYTYLSRGGGMGAERIVSHRFILPQEHNAKSIFYMKNLLDRRFDYCFRNFTGVEQLKQ